MSHTSCQPGDTTGFPLLLSQGLHSKWPATADAEGQLKKITIPTDFTVEWGPSTQSAQISVRNTTAKDDVPGVFQISGISTVTDMTTLTYGNARYSCSGVLSIVQNQHPTFSKEGNAQYEVILAFQIVNKQLNPSSPDIILLCRPIIFSTWNTSPFWPAVDEACATGKPQTAAVDLSTMFGFSSSVLMPMVTYQTCLPVKLLNYNSQPYSYGSLRMRVNVVPQPIYVVASDKGLGKCSSIRKYTLITNGSGPISIFNGTSSNSILQFRDGLGKDLFPVKNTTRLVPSAATEIISSFSDVLNKIEIQVPEGFLGKSLAEIASATKVETAKPKKRAFKCYTVDPEKDIKGDQIMIDPTTGERLKDILDKDLVNSDGSPITPTISYVLYGKGIDGDLPVTKIVPMPQQGPYGKKMSLFMTQDKDRVKVAIGEEHDPAMNNQPIPKSPTGYVLFGGNLTGMIPVTKIINYSTDNTMYFAQDGNFIRVLTVDKNYTRNIQNVTLVGDLSNLKSFDDMKNFKTDWTDDSRYSIKKTDGTGILLPSTQGVSFIGDISKINSVEDIQVLFRDPKNDVRTEAYVYKVASSQLELSSSGILPGDIEAILILICIVIGSICLFSYSGYIIHMWFYQENGFRNSAMHVGIFILLLIGLTLFGFFAGKSSQDSSS